MAERKSSVGARLPIRRGLGESEAAMYISLGTTKFAQLVKDGRMPRPHVVDGRRIWDVDDIDAAFRALPIEGDDDQDRNPWHEI